MPALAAGTLFALAGRWPAAAFFYALSLFLLQFFRDPERTPEGGPETIVSPADGTVLSVAEAPEAPAGARRKLVIFMSVDRKSVV